MKIWAIATNTLRAFLRDKVLIVIFIVLICFVLLMMTPLLAYKAITTAENAGSMQALVLGIVAVVMSLLSGGGSLLAAWAGASSVATEMRSGTIQAVMARPVKRWQFLAGKYLGVLLLMGCYVPLMFGISYLLAWMGGEHIQAAPWVLIVYPIVRYAIYAAIAILLVTFMHSAVAFGIVILISVFAGLVAPKAPLTAHIPAWIRAPIYAVLPSTGLLSESRFLSITRTSLQHTTWLQHLTTLAYGLDYALVCFLFAVWSFHYRSLRRD
ncbi:MAG TPA: ABC transporter permease subunit [Candidatus Acidoferrales bacterium]|nr:ABC transporter permease subunit [Candidatus Acidoferrales bacterium]